MSVNYRTVGQKILIKLLTAPKLKEAKEGDLIQPQFKAFETEGGRPSAKLNENEYLYKGTVLQIPPGAQSYITETMKDEVNVGDIVWISPLSINERSVFLPSRDGKVVSADGHFRISPVEIEAIELTNTTK